MLKGRHAVLSLAVLVCAALVACGGQGEPSIAVVVLPQTPTPTPMAIAAGAAPTPSPSPATTPTPTPTAAPDPTAPPTVLATPVVKISDTTVPQGGSFLLSLRAPPAAAATVSFAGRQYQMLSEGEEWWVVIGVAADLPPQEYLLQVQFQPLPGASVEPVAISIVVVDGDFAVEDIEVPLDRTNLLDPALLAEERRILNALLGVLTPQRLWSGPFLLPAQGEFSDPFGTRRSFNGGPITSYHTGMDIAADEGTPVAAANDGVVAYAGPLPVRGNAVIIDHGGGVFSGYFHLASWAVSPGQAVAAGEIIGTVGQTGLVTGPHLHWEMMVHGVNVNPLPWTQRELRP